ncbi:MFS transporter [Burkholderia ubonensis]|uniref:MFS transporter n=1 Tax=Burkholderia ubonensis TaxID=101571 RepID=A0A102X0S0_9BURK|nr:MFS transporter [Burkholderia ubonensis]KUZ75513.1 MFS transporter [Burkholderia ubonensis]KUZ90931.1 MFS transporter [Burkholderia ubonensis]KUZ93286.1 MFS transporter [Burkholderia ubonensis]KVC65943.1 MFS transporter [Burkholderia ubonensis]
MRSSAFDSAGRSRPDPSGGAVVRLALAFAAATNGLILSPFLVAAVMTRFRLDDGTATALVSVEILGIAISCALLPRRIARAARRFTLAGTLGAIAGQALSAVAPGIASAGAARGLTGLFEGMLFVVVASGVSQRASTERLWGQINLLAGGINGGILVLVSALPAAWLGRWIFALLAGVLAVLAPAIRGIDAFAAQPVQPAHARARDGSLPWRPIVAIWVVTALVYGVQASQWAIAGFVGARAGLSPPTIGVLLSVSSLLGFVGAAIPAHPGSRRHRVGIIWAAQLAVIASIEWFFGSTGGGAYFLSQLLLNSAFFVIVPFLTGMLSDVDPDGSLVARTLVVTFFAAGIGTALSGALLERYGGARVAHVLGAAVLAAAPFVRLALRRAPPAGAHGGVGHPSR